MVLQTASGAERFVANVTFEGFFAGVRPHVRPQFAWNGKMLRADGALENSFFFAFHRLPTTDHVVV